MALLWDNLTSITREKFIPKLIDNIYDKSTLLKILAIDKAVKVKGGRKVVEPIKYAKSTSGGSYAKADVFDITPANTRTAAEWAWANYYQTLTLFGQDLRENQGVEKVLDLIALEMEEAETSMRDRVSDALYTGLGENAIVGLQTAIDSSTTTYGGITSTDFSGWVSGVDSGAHTEANMKDSTSTSYVLTLLKKAFRSCLHSGAKPTMAVTTPLIWDIFEAVIIGQTSQNKTVGARTKLFADAGFTDLEFRGVPIIADEKCTAGYMYVLNTDFVTFRVHPEANFTFEGYVPSVNQDSKVGKILLQCQLAVNNRRMHYKFSGLPTS